MWAVRGGGFFLTPDLVIRALLYIPYLIFNPSLVGSLYLTFSLIPSVLTTRRYARFHLAGKFTFQAFRRGGEQMEAVLGEGDGSGV